MNMAEDFRPVWDRVIGFLPNLVGFLVLLVIGYIVAKLVAAAVRKILEKVGIDRRLQESHGHRYLSVVAGDSPAHLVARLVFWLIFLIFVFVAVGVLHIAALTTFMYRIIAYLPNIVAAILIFVVAAILAGLVAAAVNRTMGDSPTGKIAGTVLPALIMVIAGFMILQQLRIAEQIVQIAFAATMGALALGLALAFGLGGRPIAQRMLEDAYRRSQEQREERRRREYARGSDEMGHERTPTTTGEEPATERKPPSGEDQPPPGL
ncbi:mechanosensitive ion channel family protein [Actinopolymorpha rutila]|uniref:MFS family permease n=1 Tax=Actinopolymorpha rutila TaxID=446787 RepID=A0A852ZN84_9ACTN|nr:transporter [Actinopolymorpha rutila]NYH93358.1 MFS family permease [Actinopolymorpha rutila]